MRKAKQYYTLPEPDFKLSSSQVNSVWFNKAKIDINSKINDVVCREFGILKKSGFHIEKKVPIMGKDSDGKKKQTGLHIYLHCNCVLKYRMSFMDDDIRENSELVMKVFRCDDARCQCPDLPPATREIRGEARVELKQIMLEKHANKVYSQSISEASVDVAKGGNLQNIASHDVLNKIRQEIREDNLMDKNIYVDLQKRAESGRLPDLVGLRTYPKFTATFIYEGSLELLSNRNRSSTDVKSLLLDATGGITRKMYNSKSPNFHHVLLLPLRKPSHSSIPSDEHYLIPVAEAITNDSTGFTIAEFLRLVEHNLRKYHGAEQRLCDYIGTDFSWPNFYAILNLNGWSMKDFLHLAYKCFDGGKLIRELQCAILPSSCFSHLSKCIKQDINKFYEEKKDQKFIARLIGEIVTIPNPLDLDAYLKNVIVIFATKYKNMSFDAAFSALDDHFSGDSQDSDDAEEDEVEQELDDEFKEHKAIYRNSKFFQRFDNFSKSISNQKSKELNKYYSTSFLQVFLSKYVAFLPTWSIFLGRMRNEKYTRGNNARIERYFQGLKDDVKANSLELRQIGLINAADYAEFVQKRSAVLIKEAKLGIPGRKTNRDGGKKVTKSIENEREQWKRVRRKSRISNVLLEPNILSQTFPQK